MVALVSVATKNDITAIVGYVDGVVKHKFVLDKPLSCEQLFNKVIRALRVITNSVPDSVVIEVDYKNKGVLKYINDDITSFENIDSYYEDLLELTSIPARVDSKYNKTPQALIFCKRDYIQKAKTYKLEDLADA